MMRDHVDWAALERRGSDDMIGGVSGKSVATGIGAATASGDA
jgi:hypothetical protein